MRILKISNCEIRGRNEIFFPGEENEDRFRRGGPSTPSNLVEKPEALDPVSGLKNDGRIRG